MYVAFTADMLCFAERSSYEFYGLFARELHGDCILFKLHRLLER